MNSTNKLRFIERRVEDPIAGTQYFNIHMTKVLQQWWEGEELGATSGTYETVGEWRNVPVEVEE